MQDSSPCLLSLTPELRLHIYDYVFQQVLDLRPLDCLEVQRHYPPRPKGLQGSFTRIHAVRLQPTCFHIPWLNTRLSCKTLAHEIQEYMDSSSYTNSNVNHTYELDLKPAIQNQDEVGNMISVTWRTIPCPPRKVRRLIIHNNGTAIAIVTALNLFLHCGISMDRKRPLEEHLNIDELRVNVKSPRALVVPNQDPGLALPPVDEQARCRPEYESIHANLANYHRSGLLGGFIGRICVYGAAQQSCEFDVVHSGNGFDGLAWGVAAEG